MISKPSLKRLREEHGTPLLVIDHRELRKNFRPVPEVLPRVQPISPSRRGPIGGRAHALRCRVGRASTWRPCRVRHGVREVRTCGARAPAVDLGQDHLRQLRQAGGDARRTRPYNRWSRSTNLDEIEKIRKHAPHAGSVLRLKVPTPARWSSCRPSSAPLRRGGGPHPRGRPAGAGRRRGELPRGSQTNEFSRTTWSAEPHRGHLRGSALTRILQMNLVDIGGASPPYDATVRPFRELARTSTPSSTGSSRRRSRSSPSRALLRATAGYASRRSSASRCATASRRITSMTAVYHTYSGQIFDHCKYPGGSVQAGKTRLSRCSGPPATSFDVISMAEDLPELDRDDFVYSEMIGATPTLRRRPSTGSRRRPWCT